METIENKIPIDNDKLAAERMLDAAIPDENINQDETQNDTASNDEGISSLGLAAIAIHGVADLVEYQYPYLNYPEKVREEGVLKLAPVLEKYNLKSAFFEKWKLEFEFGAFMAGLIFTSYMQVKAHNQTHEKVVEPAKPDIKPDDNGVYDAGTDKGSTFKFAKG